jgi:hypothetical protein
MYPGMKNAALDAVHALALPSCRVLAYVQSVHTYIAFPYISTDCEYLVAESLDRVPDFDIPWFCFKSSDRDRDRDRGWGRDRTC